MMRFSIERKIIIAGLLIMTLVILISAFFYFSFRNFVNNSQLVSHTHEIIAELENTLSLMVDAETSQRGYIITEKREFLEPYHNAVRSLDDRLNNLWRLTQDNKKQQDLLNELQPLVRVKLNFIEGTIREVDEGYKQSAQADVLSGEGKRQMDKIRHLIREMKDEALRLLNVHTDEARKNTNRTILTTLILSAVVFGSIVFANYIILTDINRRKHKEVILRERSLVDPLTDLYNQKGFLSRARQEIEMSRQRESDAFLIYADLDGLKQINDVFGHQAGSEAIVKTAEILKQTFRDKDVLARLGGDEFSILVVDASKEAMNSILARLQNNLDKFNERDDKPYKLALSLGVAFVKGDGNPSVEELLEEADQEMYQNKRKRREPRRKILTAD